MGKEEDYFFYYKKYERLNIDNIVNNFKLLAKWTILKALVKSTIRNSVSEYDRFAYEKIKASSRYSKLLERISSSYSREEYPLLANRSKDYFEIELQEVHYFEVINIDEFENFRKKILQLFFDEKKEFNVDSYSQLKERLSQVKDDMNSITWGSLYFESFSGNANGTYIKCVEVSTIKTRESFFILRIKILPSDEFAELLKVIVSQPDSLGEQPIFNKLRKIIKSRKFIIGHSIIQSVRNRNIGNLLSDLKYQVYENVIKEFQGIFANNSSQYVPSIEVFEVLNMDGFQKDVFIQRYFDSDGPYTNDEGRLLVYLNNRFNRQSIKVVKENKNYLEHDLINTLAFPVALNAVLTEYKFRLDGVKRRVYDFAHENSSRIKLLFIPIFFKYLKLKSALTLLLFNLQRVQEEFDEMSFRVFLDNEVDLRRFKKRTTSGNELLLRQSIESTLNSKITTLNREIKNANSTFKLIEEINLFKTTVFLQIASIFIAVVALLSNAHYIKTTIHHMLSLLINRYR
jgi:hypothetical protein